MTVTGLSAFPLTPVADGRVDEHAIARLTERLVTAGVNSIAPLGSTGVAAYLTRDERARVSRIVVEHAGSVPVIVGVSAVRTEQVLQLVDDAQSAGAAAVLLAPTSYQPLTADEVHGLYADVTRTLSVPLVVYDNPLTTRFMFTDELHQAIARLPQVRSIKIPPAGSDPALARERIARLRAGMPTTVTIGISGDAAAAAALVAGADAWYSAIAGTLPELALEIIRAVRTGDDDGALARSARLQPLWDLFAAYGSLRVTAAIAEHLALVLPTCLPRPLRGLDPDARSATVAVVEQLGLR
jgi:4-hydroxy-tetrahydrodipicolinate synthase